MKGKEAAIRVEKAIYDIQMKLLGTVKDYTPALTFETYLLVKEVSEKHQISYLQVIKVMGYRDYGLEDKLEQYESRLRLHQHGTVPEGDLH